MKTPVKYALSALVAVTTIVTTVAVAPGFGLAEESVKAKTLAQIDANLDGLNEQIGGIEGQVSEVDGDIASLKGEYTKLQAENEELLKEILSYMKDDYVVSSSATTLDFLVNSDSLSQLASAEQYRNNATDVVKEKFDQYIKRAGEIEGLLSKAQEKRQGLLSLKGQLEQRRATAQAQEEARQAAAAATEAELQKIKDENEQAAATAIARGPSESPSSAPSSGGGNYNTGLVRGGNPYTPGQCTWYVYNQTGRGQKGDAGSWGGGGGFGIGKILIMPPGVGGAGGIGHVGVIVGGSPSSGIVIRDMNWAGPFVVTTHTVPPSGSYRYL